MAQLARLGLLRHVEVISTVSGGSIIGALYYLHVKRLLESKPDTRMSDEATVDIVEDRDYIQIVRDIERDFLKAVECNLRMMTYSDWRKNWRMTSPDYSRSDRLGELFDEHLYRPVMAQNFDGMIQMRDLYIHPLGPDGKRMDPFNPRKDNPGRKAKVPILLLNATALNNGHNWRFEASTMGAPDYDDDISMDIDKNIRLRRPSSYEGMIERQQDVELGLAVAASACVPGIFHPLAISDLYPDIRVELVDGGVHDNQGVQGLIDRDNCCNLLIVSDGSGQMRDEGNPNTWLAAAVNRSQGIFMKRVREEQMSRVLKEWKGRVAFFHLRQGIPARTASWYTSENKLADNLEHEPQSECESFGVLTEVQHLLSKVRTDLDSFSEVEAYSLMLDGYLVSGHVVSQTEAFKPLVRSAEELPAEDWQFMEIKPWLEKPTPLYLKHLRTAESQFFKAFKLNVPLALGGAALCILAVSWLIWMGSLTNAQISVRSLLLGGLLLAAGLLLPKLTKTFRILKFLRNPTRRLAAYLGQGVLPILGMFLVRFHLKVFDPIFIRMGRLKNLTPPG
ncbi:MAG: patatin-like phospholipase family protein [Syntrophobacteraceae bacterium]|nr:patatin-like phospholipase family protein [Syntrophobacteraceae bacterium]